MKNEWEERLKKINEEIERIDLLLLKLKFEIQYNTTVITRLKKKKLEHLKKYRY
tara:strand:- start:745 stop:906 length:162 start_codon:yes stop_codon:yes gene_type:complete